MLKDALRWLTIGGVVAIPVIIPFIVSASMFFPFITGKNFTFRIIVEIILASWVLLALLDARYRPRFSWILSAFVLFVAVVGLADLFGANPFKSFWSNFERMEGYISILHVFAYFVVAGTVLNSEKLWNVFWYSTLGASVAVALTGLAPVIDALPDIASIPRIDARFGNPIYLAVYTLFHIFIALVLMLRWRGTRWHQIALGAVVVLHLVTMVLTLTRGTVLGFLGGAIVTTILIALMERKHLFLRKAAIGTLLVVVAVVATGFAIKDTEWAKTTPVINRFTQIQLSGGTVQARFMNWGMAWEGTKERPVLGWGQGNYEYIFSKYHNPDMWGEEPWFDRTHNILFDWLVAAGFAGLITYLLIPIALLLHLWVIDPRERRWSLHSLRSFTAIKALLKKSDDAFPATERALWTGLLAAYMFHNLFVFDNLVSYMLYASVLAYLHWRVTQGHEPLWSGIEVRRETVTAVGIPVAILLTILTIYYVNVPGIRTSQALIGALVPQEQLPSGRVVQNTPDRVLEKYERALAYDQLGRQEVREQFAQMAANMQRTEGVEEEIRTAFRERSIEEMEREVERNPESARLWLFLGSVYTSAGMLDKAEEALRTAVEITPTKQSALFQRGEVLLMRGKLEESLEIFKTAYDLAPEYDEARMLYSLLLIRNGMDKEAVDLLTERYGTAAVDDSRLFMEWTNAGRYDIAAEILEQRVEANPEDIQQRVSLAATYDELGRTEEAVAILEEIIAQHPEYEEQLRGFIQDIRGW